MAAPGASGSVASGGERESQAIAGRSALLMWGHRLRGLSGRATRNLAPRGMSRLANLRFPTSNRCGDAAQSSAGTDQLEHDPRTPPCSPSYTYVREGSAAASRVTAASRATPTISRRRGVGHHRRYEHRHGGGIATTTCLAGLRRWSAFSRDVREHARRDCGWRSYRVHATHDSRHHAEVSAVEHAGALRIRGVTARAFTRPRRSTAPTSGEVNSRRGRCRARGARVDIEIGAGREAACYRAA